MLHAKEALRRQCAWCGKVLDDGGPIQDGQTVSHGICEPCASKTLHVNAAPTLADIRYRQAQERKKQDELSRARGSDVLWAVIDVLANDRELEFCGRVSDRLWKHGFRDVGADTVKRVAEYLIKNPHKATL